MEDTVEEVSNGLLIGGERLQHVFWACDTRLFAKSTAELIYMVRAQESTALWMAGMEVRLPRRQSTRVQRCGQGLPTFQPRTSSSNPLDTCETPAGACMKMVGAGAQPDGGHDFEYRGVGRVAWAAFHAKKALEHLRTLSKQTTHVALHHVSEHDLDSGGVALDGAKTTMTP